MVLYMTILTYSSDISNPWLCFVSQAVVLFAMGGYGSYLGWQIRLSDDVVNSFLNSFLPH